MGRLAVILGSNALGPGGEEIAAAAAEHGAAIAQRHGAAAYVLPHEIDHVANLRPLAEQGCDRVLAIGSVGSLDPELPVGALLCPDDFIALGLGPSAFADARAHSAPGFDSRWRGEVIEAWRASGQAPRDGGVYWQTRGPALRDARRDPPDRRPRRRGRDDDRLRVRRRR
jgi:purine nucleoside phosphorylase